ncbi:carboxypeptidase C [Malassezia vespertilionis]|uniref:Carboxypeptidase n=1 Tax=Malassezia vespertilionis TaxID=2020962 RepID=A0A2N1JCU7_9BASI|nr:carboxypeptidase C [Malassezia vespertilionis]PKI84390.1 hypothetical protein MVES_001605 [Malassezia vespertilionis]WFD06361.1 carboxypeptidase C [Malassezia vespertilionis]
MSRWWIAFAAVVAAVSARQTPYSTLNAPSLSVSEADGFSVLQHPSLPAHSLRLHKVPDGLCERTEGVTSWSGYLDVDLDRVYEQERRKGQGDAAEAEKFAGVIEHFYFWGFASRNDKAHDPVTLWMNGGPGCSSFTGLLMEIGPCSSVRPVLGRPGTELNPHAWNNNASVIFLDQPTGVGYSYASWRNGTNTSAPPTRIFDSEHAARDISAFLHLLALHADNAIVPLSMEDGRLKLPEFHLAGESYGGRYTPLLASRILQDNEHIAAHPEEGLHPLSIASVMIGNGITSPKHQSPAHVEYACTNATGHGPFLNETTCQGMRKALPACLAKIDKCNERAGGEYNATLCADADKFCSDHLESKWELTGASPYDWNHADGYVEEEYIAAFLNDHDVRTKLGIDPTGFGDAHDGVFVGCSDKVFAEFGLVGDGSRDSTWAVRDILGKGVRVLSYSGEHDFICNYIGNHDWIYDLDWQDGDNFRAAPLEHWYMHGSAFPAGKFRHYGNLTYATVLGAGHFVPHDQPAAALEIMRRWQQGSGRL